MIPVIIITIIKGLMRSSFSLRHCPLMPAMPMFLKTEVHNRRTTTTIITVQLTIPTITPLNPSRPHCHPPPFHRPRSMTYRPYWTKRPSTLANTLGISFTPQRQSCRGRARRWTISLGMLLNRTSFRVSRWILSTVRTRSGYLVSI